MYVIMSKLPISKSNLMPLISKRSLPSIVQDIDEGGFEGNVLHSTENLSSSIINSGPLIVTELGGSEKY